jgi:phosphoesterase RecJ-like protein
VPLQEMKIFAAALQRMETYFDNKVVVQEIRQEDFPNQHSQELEFLDLDYILEFNKSIQEVECVVLLRELPGEQVRVSLRSKPDFDIRPVVKRLGGGGHKNAAGANISGTISEVKGMVISLLEKSMTSKIL